MFSLSEQESIKVWAITERQESVVTWAQIQSIQSYKVKRERKVITEQTVTPKLCQIVCGFETNRDTDLNKIWKQLWCWRFVSSWKCYGVFCLTFTSLRFNFVTFEKKELLPSSLQTPPKFKFNSNILPFKIFLHLFLISPNQGEACFICIK